MLRYHEETCNYKRPRSSIKTLYFVFVAIALLTYKAPDEDVPAALKERKKGSCDVTSAHVNPSMTPDDSDAIIGGKVTRF